MTRSVGRPLKYGTPKELSKLIEEYFDEREAKELPLTITGLGIALGMDRRGICNYEKRDNFYTLIWDAKKRCEDYAEIQLYVGKNPQGAKHALSNFGWEDKKQVETTDVTQINYEKWLKENEKILDVTPETKVIESDEV